MATITINGTELATDDPKAIRKALNAARKAEKAKREQQSKDSDHAHLVARSNAWFLLSRKAGGESQIYKLYTHESRYKPFRQVEGDYYGERVMQLETAPSRITIRHYGREFMGAVATCAGYVVAIFLRDETTGQTECFGIGACGESWALADCPGITMADFRPESE